MVKDLVTKNAMTQMDGAQEIVTMMTILPATNNHVPRDPSGNLFNGGNSTHDKESKEEESHTEESNEVEGELFFFFPLIAR